MEGAVRRWTSWVLAGVGIHSLALGILLWWKPFVVLELAGWSYSESRFYPAQSGVFLVVLGLVYLGAIRHRPFAWVVVLSKAFAVIFLGTEAAASQAPSLVLVQAGADGLMGLTVLALLIAEARKAIR